MILSNKEEFHINVTCIISARVQRLELFSGLKRFVMMNDTVIFRQLCENTSLDVVLPIN